MQPLENRALAARNQLELWAAPPALAMPGLRVRRRDSREAPFDLDALSESIRRAAWPGEALDDDIALSLARAVRLYLQQSPQPVSVETLRQTVERLLIEMGYTLTARMYAGAFAPAHETNTNSARLAGMFDEALSIDRAERFLAAAATDAGLDRPHAEELLAVLLGQIRDSGIRRLTPGLLREWMRSELISRDLTGHAAKIARLTLPVSALHDVFTDDDRSASDLPNDPESAALALAGRVSAAYVLGQLMPSAVGQAHLRGDIQVRGAGNFLRLDSVILDPRQLTELAALPNSAGRLAARIADRNDAIFCYFGGQVAWSAINFGVAPFAAVSSDDELRALAREIFFEQPAGGRFGSSRATIEYRLAWDAPEGAAAAVAGGECQCIESAYTPARRFFTAAIEAIAEAADHGWLSDAAHVAIHLSPYFFGAPESETLLDLLGRIAASPLPVTFRYDSAAPLMFPDPAAASPRVVAQTVSIAVARAAKLSGDIEDFLARLDRSFDCAVAAHRAKREFLDRLLHERGGPLSALARGVAGIAIADPSSLRYHVAADDASAGSITRAGVPWIVPGDEYAVAEAAISHLRDACARSNAASGPLLALVDAAAARPALNASLRYARSHDEALALEAPLHPFYDEPPAFALNGESFATPHDAAGFIRRAFLHTPCRALRFT